MHPGANVGMDLVLWLGLIVTGVFAILPGIDNLSRSDNLSYYSYESSRRGRLQRALHRLGVVEVVACAFTFLAMYDPLFPRRKFVLLMTAFQQPPPLYPLRLGLRRR